VGDPAFELAPCTTSGDCGLGTCVDACPSGDCVPLCTPQASDLEEGECVGGPTEFSCSIEEFRACNAAALNGTCDAVCATSCDSSGVPTGGSMTACTGLAECPNGEVCCGDCLKARACEAGSDGVLGTIDDIPGAGVCTEMLRECFLPDLAAEGGDIFNGKGDPVISRSVSVYCTAANVAPVANVTAGLGGPGRIRSDTVNLTNGFETLP
jgi:hypothetical protein